MVRVLAVDDYDVHRLIYEAFARDSVRDFFFAPFPVSGELHGVLVRFGDVKTCFAEGQGFHMILRAFPTVKVGGKRRSIGAARAKDGLACGAISRGRRRAAARPAHDREVPAVVRPRQYHGAG